MKAEERWQARFRAPRVTLPTWARQAPHRAVYRGNASGAWEIYAWDRSNGRTRQVTDRPHGTRYGAIDPTGRWVWWFGDDDGDGQGVWSRQPFDGGPDVPLSLPPGHPGGLALASDGTAAVGRSSRDGFEILLARPGDEPVRLYHHDEYAVVADMSLDGAVVAVNHSEHGDLLHPAVRVVKANGSVVAELDDGPGKGVIAARFAPVPGDRRLLVLHERRGRREPLVWDPVTGEQREIWLRVRGEISADWYDDGRALLIVHNHRGRTELLRYDLAGGGLTPIDSPHGVIEAAAPRPDGTVEYAWSSAAHPPVIRSSNGHVVFSPGRTPPPSVPLEDIDVDGPGGRIHALVSRPERAAAPYPAVFLLHSQPAAFDGVPGGQDDDSFQPQVAAWVDNGFAVIRVNHRGSAGYGSAWRDALRGDVGHIELADVAAVRDWAVEHGIADPDRLVLAGAAWGGYLTLLALGTQPKAWAAGIATTPIPDHAAMYEHEAECLRAAHRALLGGSPAEVPDRYAASSPITYADMVEAPLLIIAGDDDPHCPMEQVEHYVRALADHGREASLYRYAAGPGGTPAVEERIRQMGASIEFAVRALGGA
ncbi:prolyl oligopeptidase family serine peptidase [Microbispora triticiradicis]|uniref:S9 family peptidase n=1 Tax=Microbispora triticiradicis TaxID=2200763 RepID=UPI001AD70D7E|nr:prolyl oligopeptidase family serine peptidase [Microbispora triticiradicis]MBO4273873.1 prolyl oligopeptidase family serine peptidase [Microbispora triticiradicis]